MRSEGLTEWIFNYFTDILSIIILCSRFFLVIFSNVQWIKLAKQHNFRASVDDFLQSFSVKDLSLKMVTTFNKSIRIELIFHVQITHTHTELKTSAIKTVSTCLTIPCLRAYCSFWECIWKLPTTEEEILKQILNIF